MSRKGYKNVRGEPELYDELKKRVTMAITPTGLDGLDVIAQQLNMSRSELVEQIGRGLIKLQVDCDRLRHLYDENSLEDSDNRVCA